MGTFQEFPLGVRLANVAVAYCWYLWKMVWPTKLALLYPHPGAGLPTWQVIGSVVLLGLISTVAIHQRRRRPYLLMGWLWYLVTMLPVIGLVQIGDHSVADRYSYIPFIGLFIAIAWLASELVTKRSMGHARVAGLAVAGVAIVAAFAFRTYREAGCWRDGTSLFSRALEVTSDNYIMHNSLGNELFGDDPEAAKRQFELALRIEPNYAPALQNLGAVLLQQGRLDQAIPRLRRASELDPESFSARANLGQALMTKGDFGGAAAAFEQALRLNPGNEEIRAKLVEAREMQPRP